MALKRFESFGKRDKYEVLELIQMYFTSISDEFREGDYYSNNNHSNSSYRIFFNDSSENKYADDNYYISIEFSESDSTSFDKGVSSDVESIRNSNYYEDIKDFLDKLSSIDELENAEIIFLKDYVRRCSIKINILLNKGCNSYKQETINYLTKKGFKVGDVYLEMKMTGSVIIRCVRPRLLSPLSNRSDALTFETQVRDCTVYDGNYNILYLFKINEILKDESYSVEKIFLMEH